MRGQDNFLEKNLTLSIDARSLKITKNLLKQRL